MVCGTAIHWPGPRGQATVCHDANCRIVIGRRDSMPPAAFALYFKQQVKLLQNQRQRLEAHQRQVSEKNAREAVENAAHWAAMAEPLQAHGAESLPRLALPSGPGRQAPLPERRRRRYRDHLNRIIAQAMATDPLPLATPWLNAPPGEDKDPGVGMRGHMCALCGGGCCTSGGEEAYLTAATIRRVMAAQPTWRPRDVLAAYLDRLAPRTQAASCVNHTATGCSLPRELRSETCNRYVCPTVARLREQQLNAPADAPVLAVVAVVRRLSHWDRDTPGLANPIIRSGLVTAAGVTPLGAALPATDLSATAAG